MTARHETEKERQFLHRPGTPAMQANWHKGWLKKQATRVFMARVQGFAQRAGEGGGDLCREIERRAWELDALIGRWEAMGRAADEREAGG